MDSDSDVDLLQSYSDTELVRRIIASPSLAPTPRVSLLSSSFVAKHYQPDEVGDMIKAIDIACQLSSHAPTVKRIIRNGPDTYCVMDRIPGRTLEDVWTQLGCPGDMEHFFRFWINFTSMRKAMQTAHQREMSTPEHQMLPTGSFVFTHHDLAPRNILLSPSGELWLLDWDLAGFYPIYFEYAAMQNFRMPQHWGFFRTATVASILLDSDRFTVETPFEMNHNYDADNFIIAQLQAQVTRIQTLTFTVEAHTTVQTITDLINSKGRDRYKFTEEWEGCRFWIYTFVKDLESVGLIPGRSGNIAWEGVSYYWRTPSGSEPREVKQGVFY
ncbi:hypothetical protein NUU61_000217 [Penicillium alfredii]|uniref:DUF7770 domain-containing protein n=1 Tax=Penicillium alfredii TaxID=1506179 RepID=A0A9W9G9B1_9EURO|nr:uncharacterized protein NUU61_000217 [Penicillium alfredii]KAJ5114458.1 hypothetical protein NUU61_000217 [Penicillium alfredii]